MLLRNIHYAQNYTIITSYTNCILWSAYHASVQEVTTLTPAINSLLPLFVDSVQSVAMIKHFMTIVKELVQHLNPGQVPVVTADQPLLSLIVLCAYLARYPRRELHTL